MKKCTNYFYHPGTSIRNLEITNDGNFLIGGTLDNKMYIWKIFSNNQSNTNNNKPKIYNYDKGEQKINFESFLYYTKTNSDKINPMLLLGDDEGNLLQMDLNNGNIVDNLFTNVHQAIFQIYFYSKDNIDYLYIFTNEQTLIKIKINILNDNISSGIVEDIIPFYCQEILSLKWLNNSNFIFSSNDNILKAFDITKDKVNLYEGHTDFIMSIIIKDDLVITTSKDSTIRIWKISENLNLKCISILRGHSEPVNCSDVLIKKNINYLISGCKDGSIKLWDINDINDTDELKEINESLSSKVVHDNEINSIKFSPNGKIFASASYDKNIKILDISNNNINILNTLSGHKKGVTDISFNPYAKIMASCGTDKLIKMWNLVDYSCMNTYEGHLSSVLKIDWIYRGTHLISGGGDGLIKLWNIKTSENILTLDAHDGKIWALDVNKNDGDTLSFISGGTDGKIILWKDNTKEEEIKLSLELEHKKNFIEAFDNYLKMRINEEIQKINEKNNLFISNYTLPKIKDVDSSNDALLNIIIQNEKELDDIYTFSLSAENEKILVNSYENVIDIICQEEQLKELVVNNINKIMDIILENNINVKGCLASQVLLKIVLKYVTPERFYKKIVGENKNEIDEETLQDILESGIYSSLGVKGGKALSKEEKKEIKMLQRKSKREEETLLQKLEIIEGYNNQHLKRIKKEIINSQILGYEINKFS